MDSDVKSRKDDLHVSENMEHVSEMLPGEWSKKEKRKRRDAPIFQRGGAVSKYPVRSSWGQGWDLASQVGDQNRRDRRIKLAKFKSSVAREHARVGKLSGARKAEIAKKREDAVIRRALVRDINRMEKKELVSSKKEDQFFGKDWHNKSAWAKEHWRNVIAPDKYNKWVTKEDKYAKGARNFINRGYQNILLPRQVQKGVKLWTNRWNRKASAYYNLATGNAMPNSSWIF